MIRVLPWFIVGSLAFAGAAQWYGYRAGYAAAVKDHQAAQVDAMTADAVAEQERQELQARRDAIALKLEDEANAEPIANPVCLPASRVRRLRLR